MTESIYLPAVKTKSAAVVLPGFKSISNRPLPLAALSDNVCEIYSPLKSDDTDRMLDVLAVLGVKIEFLDGGRLKVYGTSGRFPNRSADLFLGNAGTAFCPLAVVSAVLGGSYSLHGVPHMHECPIGDLANALWIVGADVCYEDRENYPPLHINERTDSGVREIPIRGDASSQLLTAILMALPLTGQAFEIRIVGEPISKPYIDTTLKLMAQFGVSVANEGYHMFKIPAGACYYTSEHSYVEGDVPSTSYFLAARLITGVPTRVTGIGRNSMQGGVAFAHELEKIGADVLWGNDFIEVPRPETRPAQAFDLDVSHIPDVIMTLVVAALAVDAPCTLRNIGSWRVRETDHITAVAAELCKLGAVMVEEPEAARVIPPEQLRTDAIINTYDDHRIVMCFSPVSPMGVPIVIDDPRCTHKTFPTYFDIFAGLSVGRNKTTKQ